MHPRITVLVVGAGRFGRNYVRILSRLNAQPPGGVPRIGTLVLSRTDPAKAEALASEVTGRPDCAVDEVVGVAVNHPTQLQGVIDRYNPFLTCITARDSELGDDIHPLYSQIALAGGAVLCEKPFGNALGDGRSLERVAALIRHPHAGRFGLELPMAVLGRAMYADNALNAQWQKAREIEFVWEKEGGSADLVSDLAIHPWSLLPDHWPVEVESAVVGRSQAKMVLRLHPDAPACAAKPCRITLNANGSFRGLRLDDQAMQIRFAQGRLQLLQYPVSWSRVKTGDVDESTAQVLLTVDNPLKHHITAALSGKPLVDLHKTYRSQQFLESVAALTR